jgi:long-chain acyl-CoA synthetase
MKHAIRFEGLSYTYEDLTRVSQTRARTLKQMGIRPQDRIALLFPNCPDFIFWYFAIIHLGAVVVPLHISLTQEEIQTVIADCSASLLITSQEQRYRVVSPIPVLFTEDKEYTDGCPLLSPYPTKDDDILAILYTSGTTGNPKGVALTLGNIRFVADAICKYCNTTENDRLLLTVPISHCFGQNLIMHHALQAKACLILTRSFIPHSIRETIEKERVSMVFGVPTMYRLILQTSPTKEQFSSIRYCHSGAASLDREIFDAWLERFGIPIHQGYGLTESSPLACYNDSPIGCPTSIGRPIQQVKVKLINDQGNEASSGEPGEIVISGPNIMNGYWNRADETMLAIKDGWLYSGDIGRRDDQGNFYLVDRKKDLINVSGLKVYPTEVEQVLQQHPSIKEAAVIGTPDSIVGERVRAFIILKETHQLSEAEIIRFCRNKLAPFKIPTTFTQVTDLPRNSTGKLLRKRLATEMPI